MSRLLGFITFPTPSGCGDITFNGCGNELTPMKTLVLSDIHGNWAALKAVLQQESDADRVLCLGDLVNYGPQPVECVLWAMRQVRPSRVIQGNHDLAFSSAIDSFCPPVARRTAEAVQLATSHLLTSEMKRFLGDLQAVQRFGTCGFSCVACHALPSDPLYGLLANQDAFGLWESEINTAGHPDILFVGHTHVPLKVQFQRTLVVNPGSVGLPRDGDPRASYAIWQEDTVHLRKVPYAIDETIRAFAGLDMDESMRQRLLADLNTGGRVEHSGLIR